MVNCLFNESLCVTRFFEHALIELQQITGKKSSFSFVLTLEIVKTAFFSRVLLMKKRYFSLFLGFFNHRRIV